MEVFFLILWQILQGSVTNVTGYDFWCVVLDIAVINV